MENGRFAFLRPPFGWGLGATYDVYLKPIGKRVVHFLLALIENFWLGVTAEALTSAYRLKISVFAPTGWAGPKIPGRRGTGVNDGWWGWRGCILSKFFNKGDVVRVSYPPIFCRLCCQSTN